jgi:phosphatidylglycerol:prolipoprotein diacylglycerol transferase
MVALGFLAGLWVTVRLARRGGLNPELATNLAVYSALGGLLGAKILMLMFDWRGIGEVFTLNTLQAAGVFQGGLILALVVAFFYTRKQGMPVLATADAFAPGVALGHGIGRLGCFAAGCCWGQQCNRFWAVTFHNPDAALLTGVPLDTPLHPSQLYEAGRIIGLFLLLGSAARFGIEFTRFHEQALPFGLPLSITQWIAIGLALVGVLVLRASSKHTANPAEAAEPKVRPQTA